MNGTHLSLLRDRCFGLALVICLRRAFSFGIGTKSTFGFDPLAAEHDLNSFLGAACREDELVVWNCAGLVDDLKEDGELYGLSW